MNTCSATDRILNFSAGPATLPESVLRQAQVDLFNIDGSGIGICEHSHRGPVFGRVLEEAVANCREVGQIPDDFEILFLQGGASMQFTMIPMNFMFEGQVANYLDTGVWTNKSIIEAKKIGPVHLAYDGSQTSYDHCPVDSEIDPEKEKRRKDSTYSFVHARWPFCAHGTTSSCSWAPHLSFMIPNRMVARGHHQHEQGDARQRLA